MAKLSTNIIASFAARGWAGLLSLLAVPLYLKFIGMEAYGVIGVFVTLQTFLSLLDFGLGATLTREAARVRGDTRHISDLVKTLEMVFFAVALLSVLLVWLAAPLVSQYWLRPQTMTIAEISRAITIAGVSFALLWPSNLYGAGLVGLQRQVSLAWIFAAAGTLRVALTVLALWLWSPTLPVFFGTQAAVNLLQTIWARTALRRCFFNQRKTSVFRPAMLRAVAGFATGITGITLTSIILMQVDKAVLSKTLPLDAFGYYVAGSTLASGLYVAITPLFGALFSRFSELVGADDFDNLTALYHISSQLLAVTVLPIAITGAFFSKDIVWLWTHNEVVANRSHLIFALLILGNAMNGLVNVPYALQLAKGWTSLALYSNITGVAVGAPLIYFLSSRLGAVSGAVVWLALTTAYALCGPFLTHRRLLPEAQWRWYVVDVARPGIGALLTVTLAHSFIVLPPLMNVVDIAIIASVLGIAGAVALALAPDLRGMFWTNLQRRVSRWSAERGRA